MRPFIGLICQGYSRQEDLSCGKKLIMLGTKKFTQEWISFTRLNFHQEECFNRYRFQSKSR